MSKEREREDAFKEAFDRLMAARIIAKSIEDAVEDKMKAAEAVHELMRNGRFPVDGVTLRDAEIAILRLKADAITARERIEKAEECAVAASIIMSSLTLFEETGGSEDDIDGAVKKLNTTIWVMRECSDEMGAINAMVERSIVMLQSILSL